MNKINKKIYFKKGYYLRRFICASFSIILAIYHLVFSQRIIEFDSLLKYCLQFYYIIWSIFALLQFISAYQIDKLPNIVFKDDEMIQFIGLFRIKEKIKLNDIKDFKTGKYFFEKCIIFTLKNNKIKRFRLGGISKSDREYIINLLKERISKDKNPKTLNSYNEKRRANE